MKLKYLLLSGLCVLCGITAADVPEGMALIPAGEFTMGSKDAEARSDEQPLHRVKVDAFYMDTTEVTNGDFAKFVAATGYVTTAEKKPTLEEIMAQVPPGTPPPPEETLVAGSLVFHVPAGAASYSPADWWAWTPGASWKHPEGPDSTIAGKDTYPVVQVSWDDAVAYAKWAGKRLPTEAEWEFAARGGLEGKPYTWGDEAPDDDNPRANIWHGEFPTENTERDGFVYSAPVKTFKPNGYGLYDMAGNVWEWCADWYRPDTYTLEAKEKLTLNPKGPKDSYDPDEPTVPKRVQRGGSFLCHASYCASYRPAARMKCSPDTGLMHSGFRCVKDVGKSAE